MHFTIYYNQITHIKVISGLHFGVGLTMHVGYECFEIGLESSKQMIFLGMVKKIDFPETK